MCTCTHYDKLLTVVLMVVIFTGSAITSRAQETPTTSAKTIPPSTTQASSTPATEASSRSSLSQQTQARVQNLAFNIANRLDAAQYRLSQIAERLDRRLEKNGAAGYAVATAPADIENAKIVLLTIEDKLASFDQVVMQVLTSENPQAEWRQVKRVIESMVADLQTTKQLLLSAARTLETQSTNQSGTSSSSDTNN